MGPDITSLGALFKTHGLETALSICFVAILIFVLKWVFSIVDSILKQAAAEREAFVEAIGQLTSQIMEHQQREQAFSQSVQEAHGYQRQEHMKQIESLQKINFSADNICSSIKDIVNGLQDTLSSLKEVSSVISNKLEAKS